MPESICLLAVLALVLYIVFNYLWPPVPVRPWTKFLWACVITLLVLLLWRYGSHPAIQYWF